MGIFISIPIADIYMKALNSYEKKGKEIHSLLVSEIFCFCKLQQKFLPWVVPLKISIKQCVLRIQLDMFPHRLQGVTSPLPAQ